MKKQYLYFLVFLLAHLLLYNEVSAQYSWKQRASIGGLGRLGPFGFSISNKGYIGGGSNDFVCLNDFWEYDPTTNAWTQKSDAPVSLNAAGYFVINGKGYITGGAQNISGFNSQLWMYDPTSNTWTSEASYPGTPIYGGASFSIGAKGYYGIGNSGTRLGPYYTDFYEYDPSTNTWTKKANFPGPSRYGVTGIALNGYGYVGFGVNENTSTLFNDWWQYDPVADSWTTQANYPGIQREYPMGFTINNLVYIGTGDNSGSALNDFYQYDPGLNTWAPIANYGGGYRWASIAFSIGNIGYFGAGNDFMNDTTDFWEYAPSSPPVASFQSSDSSICVNYCINFNDHSTNATSWLWFFPGAAPVLSTDENPRNVCYHAAGDYDVMLIASSDAGSDTLYMTKYITVNASPPTPVITQVGNKLSCSTDSTYTSYQWYYANSAIPGATDTFLVAAYNGNYNVSVTNKYGCSVAVGINVIIGIAEVEWNPYFAIYPNPVSNYLNLSILKAVDKADIEIFDVLGKRVFFQTVDSSNGNHLILDFKSYSTGVYILVVNMDGAKFTKKLLRN